MLSYFASYIKIIKVPLICKLYNKWFQLKLKPYKYNVSLAMTGAIKGSPREKIYQELALETLHKRRWLYILYLFYKTQKKKPPSYFLRLISTTSRMHLARNFNNLKGLNVKHNFFKNSFFHL